MAQKWVINNGNLVLGDVRYHNELCRDNTLTKGGGFWYLVKEIKTIYLYGDSTQFGQATKKQLEQTNIPSSLDQYTVVFSTQQSLAKVIKEGEIIIVKK